MLHRLNRREFITLLSGAAAAWPFAARAQQEPERTRRIGFWVGEPESNPNAQRRVAAFKQGLQNLNWRDGHNVKIEYRWAILNLDGIRADAANLIALKPDVIVTTGAPTVAALLQVTRSISIVLTFVTDPVRDGFVASLSHPGGNITGFTIFEHTMVGKWLEMRKEAAPHITRVAVMKIPNIRRGTRT
jgi:putative tryptophan/tyrosine transport system substrate-binding protein